MSVAGLLNTPKYTQNIIRVGDIGRNAPHTILYSTQGTVIKLPLPINLSSAQGSDWQQQQVSAMGMVGRHYGKEMKSMANDVMSAGSLKDGLSKLGVDMFKQADADMASVLMRAEESKSQLAGLKLATNPRNEMLFNGMQFKSYSFNFNLVPMRKEDSDSIQTAIRTIQRASAPSMKGAKMFMTYPDTWNITFMSEGSNEGNEYLMKINECCCTNVGVNYTPQGSSNNLHKNNAPLAVELSLDFTEVVIPTIETIDEGYNG